jgi:hypothetical protein
MSIFIAFISFNFIRLTNFLNSTNKISEQWLFFITILFTVNDATTEWFDSFDVTDRDNLIEIVEIIEIIEIDNIVWEIIGVSVVQVNLLIVDWLGLVANKVLIVVTVWDVNWLILAVVVVVIVLWGNYIIFHIIDFRDEYGLIL